LQAQQNSINRKISINNTYDTRNNQLHPSSFRTTQNNMSQVIDDSCAPQEFVCPISLQIMKDPVMSKFGQNYDRQAILQWLNRGNENCPLTRRPLKPSLLAPNSSLKMRITKWKVDQGCTDDDDSVSGQEDNGFVGLMSVEKKFGAKMSWAGWPEPADVLLELYNEVLELTSTPMDAPMPARAAASSSAEVQEDTLNEIALKTTQNNRRWRPKRFMKRS
jgi:hypothetical protein